ncbi:helix-turn-helix domain-containing protein [Eggerthella guodeyinii]|uniref:Helix-turn-helix domain-containing protein n=1 Tax=Eggerthella guodeyinii TaxID=2690837 RepID=A0A6N7RL38_9ACTN|nr:helix-turn-helix transcriptional regulator [Eggerthella guodeyinii]MRX81732.1 helix-turn-helix domain-containing protein [Eggerthella guodeyinii]
MSIKIRLDEQMTNRGISLNDLSAEVGITNVNLSRIKTGKVKAVRFRTLESLCTALDCQPGDILYHVPDADESLASDAD